MHDEVTPGELGEAADLVHLNRQLTLVCTVVNTFADSIGEENNRL